MLQVQSSLEHSIFNTEKNQLVILELSYQYFYFIEVNALKAYDYKGF